VRRCVCVVDFRAGLWRRSAAFVHFDDRTEAPRQNENARAALILQYMFHMRFEIDFVLQAAGFHSL